MHFHKALVIIPFAAATATVECNLDVVCFLFVCFFLYIYIFFGGVVVLPDWEAGLPQPLSYSPLSKEKGEENTMEGAQQLS